MVDAYSSEVLAVITAVEADGVPSSAVLYAAVYGGMYDDPNNPTGPKIHFQGCIKSDVIFRKQIGIAFWKEESNIDFGYLDLAAEDQSDDFISFGKFVSVANITFYRVNLTDPESDQLDVLAVARTSDIGFADENTLRLRMESVLQEGFESPINELYYGYEYPSLAGTPYPIAWGLISDPQQLWETVMVDETSLLYHVTDLPIHHYGNGVYDRGILLQEPTSFNPTTYGFTLNQNPSGRLTAGRIYINDPYDPTGYLHGLFRITRLAAHRVDLWNNIEATELQQLEDDIGFGELFPFFHSLNKAVAFEKFLTFVLQGVTGWYSVDELSVIHFGRMVDPDAQSSVSYTFDDSSVIGRIRVEDDKAPGLTNKLGFAYSPGAYTPEELAGGADWSVLDYRRVTVANSSFQTLLWTADNAGWTADNTIYTADGYAGQVQVSYVNTYWRRVETREPIEAPIAASYGSIDGYDLAQGEVNRWWSELYYKRRRFYSFDVKLNDPMFATIVPTLGDFISLQSDRFKLLETAKNLFIRRMKFNYSKGLITIEAWG